jgi:hypothetical protein
MNTSKTSNLLRTLFLVASFLSTAISPIQGQSIPKRINYQGKLIDAAGKPLADGLYGVAFRIWSKKAGTESGDQLVWGQELSSVSVINGAFNVILGSGSSLPDAGTADLGLAFTESDRFLGITITKGLNALSISNPSEIAPRQQILSAPFSFTAGNGVPKGGVIMWFGNPANIPPGWALCDGSNGTPDLRDRFIVGAGGKYMASAIGGSETGKTLGHILTTAEMPSHNHTVQINDASGAGPPPRKPETAGVASTVGYPTSFSGGDQPHSHDLDPSTKLPPYYALAFIMKLWVVFLLEDQDFEKINPPVGPLGCSRTISRLSLSVHSVGGCKSDAGVIGVPFSGAET